MAYIALYSDYLLMLLMSLIVLSYIKFHLRKMENYRIMWIVEMVSMAAIMLTAAWSISNRPGDIEGDTAVYLDFFETIAIGQSNPFPTLEPGFIWLSTLLTTIGAHARVLFFLVPVLLSLSYQRLAIKVFGARSAMTLLTFAALLVYPFFLSLTANVIRQGIAMALVLYAITSMIEERPGTARAASVAALLFHRSSIIVLPWVFFRKACERIPLWGLLAIWLLVSVASYFSMFKMFATLVFDQLSAFGLSVNYADAASIDYQTGFRFSFWLFSSISVVFICAVKLLGYYHSRVTLLFKLSCYFGIIHISMFDLAYNDRFGLYAWILYPIQILFLLRCLLIRLTQSIIAGGNNGVLASAGGHSRISPS